MSKDFFDLVKDMRQAQKDYFRTRDANKLMESKRLEAEVDKWLDRHEEDKQGPSLFGGSGKTRRGILMDVGLYQTLELGFLDEDLTEAGEDRYLGILALMMTGSVHEEIK